MKFRFCGQLDCPDWVLTEIPTLSKIDALRMRLLLKQIAADKSVITNYSKVSQHTNDLSGPNEIKGALACIHFILTMSAKYNISSDVLLAEIQQLGLPKDCSEALVSHYSAGELG